MSKAQKPRTRARGGDSATAAMPARADSPTSRLTRLDDRTIALLIAAFAFGLRLFHVFSARSMVFFDSLIVDAKAYDAWAQRIVAGDWLRGGVDGVFYQAPLYPYFLAVLQFVLGRELLWIRVVQAAIGAASCALLFLAGQRFVGRAAGVVAGLMLALYPPAIFFDALIQKTVLDSLFITMLLWLLARRQDAEAAEIAPAPARAALGWAAVGVVMGLLTLTRENAVVIAPAIVIWIVARFRRRPRARRAASAACFVAGMLLTLLPVGVRNLMVGGEFALTTSQAGPNFYIGNHAGAFGVYEPLKPNRSDPAFERADATGLAENAAGRKLTPGEVSRYWLGRSWEFITSQPGAWLTLLGRKCLLTVNWYEITDAEDYYFYQLYCPLIRALDSIANMGVLVPLAIAGIVLTWPRRRDVWLLYLLSATIAAGVALFYVFARYRFPLVPMLILFAAAACVEAVRSVLARRFAVVGWAAIPAAFAAFASNVTFEPLTREGQFGMCHVNYGFALNSLNRFDEAIPHFREAIRRTPRFAPGYYYLGKNLMRARKVEEAIRVLEAGLAAAPEYPRTLTQLGTALAARGDWSGARARLEKSVQIDPDDGETHFRLGSVLAAQREFSPAVIALRRATELSPDSAEFLAGLAWILAVCPDASVADPAAAVERAEKLCRMGAKSPAADVVAACNEGLRLDVLAAAYGSAGRFEDAVRAGTRAVELLGNDAAAAEVAARLKDYREGRPYRLP